MRAAFITAFFSALLLTSCLEAQHFPVPEATVPAGAPPARIPAEFVPGELGQHLSDDGSLLEEGPRFYSWIRGFNYGNGWDALVRHVDGQLTPLGYRPDTQYGQKSIPDIPGVARGTIARGWVSGDGKFQVLLFNVAFIKDRAPGYVSAGDANYILAIDQVKDLPPAVEEKLRSAGG
jgi:hypothetical protein